MSADADFRAVDPADVQIEPLLFHLEPTDDFVASVEHCGVLDPILVEEVSPGRLVLLAGRQRLAAARSAGQPIPVRVLHGTPAENRLAAFNEGLHRRCRRSTVERAWEIAAYLEVAAEEGRDVSVRTLARELSVSVGTAHTWVAVGKALPRERVARLVENAHIEPQRLIALPVRDLKRLLKAPDDRVAVEILREITAEPKKDKPQSTGFWVRLRGLLFTAIAWIRVVLAVVAPRPRRKETDSST